MLNGLITTSRLAPFHSCELAMAWLLIEALSTDSIALYDRGFACYKTIALHRWAEQERRFVIRANEQLKVVRDFLARGVCSEEVMLYPGHKARVGMRQAGFVVSATTGVRVRLVRVELGEGKSPEVLFTNLWEHEGYESGLFKELYFKRWGVETIIERSKNKLQLETFSGLSVESVYQDFYATVLMSNLSSLLASQAQGTDGAPVPQTVQLSEQPPAGQHNGGGNDASRSKRKWDWKINMNKATGRVRQQIVALFLDPDRATVLLRVIACLRRHKVPLRPGRHYERRRKNRSLLSKHRTYTNYKTAC